MILSSSRIYEEIKKGNIEIEPFDFSRLEKNPNSYNLCLADELVTYDNAIIDMKREEPYTIEKIPHESGKLLIPGKLYLGRTIERTRCNGFVPMLEGRSSVGKCGAAVHVTAGFGDNGFNGCWTLEIFVIQPTIIYPGIEIAQIYFHTIAEATEDYSALNIAQSYTRGKYQNSMKIETSKLWQEF